MVSFLYSAVSVIVVLGFMILIHEFGHYAAAKLLGVRVEVFSIGFGKRLLGFRRGDTDYRISALPLGGYVKMSGVNAIELPEDRPQQNTDDAGEFQHHPRWHRLIIAAAGPFMNILLAVGLLTFVYMAHYEHPYASDQPAVIGWTLPHSAAEKAGLQAGDRILKLDGDKNPTWEDAMNKVRLSPGQNLPIEVERGGQKLEKTLIPEPTGPDQIGEVGWVSQQPFIVTGLEDGMPAAKAGLQINDQVLSVDGHAVSSPSALRNYLQTTKDKQVELTVLRQGKTVVLPIVPAMDSERHEYRTGFISEPMHVDRLSFGAALTKSLEQNKKYSMLVIDMVKGMAERKISIRQMSSPIGLSRVSGQLVRRGMWTSLVEFMAIISLQLGIFNLFPIPILDGGLIVMLLIESAMRRDISEGIKIRLYQAAFVCLMLFAGLVIINDVVKLFPSLQ